MTLEDIKRIDAERAKAMIDGDVETLRRILHKDAAWVHASSIPDTKDSFLAGFVSGHLKTFALDYTDVVIRIFGDSAVVTGLVKMDAAVAGERREANSRFVSVWADGPNGPQLIHWQSTRLPPKA